MKILLLNNNPVVNKLVTLSVQKTSDELSIAESIEAIEPKNYDLLIVDDAFYSENFMQDIGSKIKFNKSLFICAKDAKFTEEFTRILKKPFLPTDLVEVLISLGKMVDTIELDKMEETHDAETDSFDDLDEAEGLDEIDGLDDLDEFEGFDELEGIDELDQLDNLDKKPKSKPAEEELNIDETDDTLEDDSLEGFEELGLDELDENEEYNEFEDLESDDRKEADGILDKDELQEVQNLLEETEMEEDLGFDDSDLELEDFEESKAEEIEAEEVKAEEPADDLEFDESDLELEDFEEEESLEKPESNEAIDEFEEDLESKEVTADESEPEEQKAQEPVDDFEDLASQIESAVQALSDEDLQTEVDQDLLFNIDSLSSRDLKLAIGEEVNDEEFDKSGTIDEAEPHDEEFEEDFSNNADSSSKSGNEGVEALKKLLKALSNEDVAASLKGMKISINITLGDR
ncbi:MAG: DNA topoisomerase IV [Sulfurimonas sp.]|nr:DNA topoisomerase IV [Sulfurimonas sp.]